VVPPVLRAQATLQVLSQAIRSRHTGSLAFETDDGVRRVVFYEGDFANCASGVAGESIIAFLTERGYLMPAQAAALEHRLPAFGRHAGAALIARGHLKQDELWPVLRAHAQWLLGKVMALESGSVEVEAQVPARLAAEPSVFGGATGAEVFVETVQSLVDGSEALRRLGGPSQSLGHGPGEGLLSESALSSEQTTAVYNALGRPLGELDTSSGDLLGLLYALTKLEVLSIEKEPSRLSEPPERTATAGGEALDEDAVRERVRARRHLVDEADYFRLLGLSAHASGYDVRRAYAELRRQFEPTRLLTARTSDLLEDVQLILDVLDEAYEILREEPRRERYRKAILAQP
jgi:hypothetical protein